MEAVLVKKTVTAKQAAANRLNSQDSTGPRTERGKSNSKFNAVKSGLFAEEVIIPNCDGDDARRNFSMLLQDLCRDLEPVGRLQKELVQMATEGVWRVRRAARAEYGAIRVRSFWDRPYDLPEGAFIDKLNRSVDLERVCLKALTDASEEIRRTGTLTTESFQKVRLLIEDQQCHRSDSKNNEATSEPVIDDDFRQRLDRKAASLRFAVLEVDRRVVERNSDFLKQGALPSAEDCEKISRYRIRAEKEIDWALSTLFLLQKRNKRKTR